MKQAAVTIWVASAIFCLVEGSAMPIDMKIGNVSRWNITRGQSYKYSVHIVPESTMAFSSFLFQVHAEKFDLTLSNASVNCTLDRECKTTGTHVGLVQILPYRVSMAVNFSVEYSCEDEGNCSKWQEVLVAVVGIPIDDPIPGGCSLTSALEIEAGLSLAAGHNVSFQDSDIGFNPMDTTQPPCSDKFAFITRLQYQVYQKCVSHPDTNKIFGAIESMLTAGSILGNTLSSPLKTLSYTEVKRVVFYMQEPGMVLNVIAKDTGNGRVSAYIPTVACDCDYSSGQCGVSISAITWVCGLLVGITGLYLCCLAHRFFHAEVLLFTLLISTYVMYTVLFSVTTWKATALAVGTMGLALSLTLLLFILWFFTNWRFLFLLLFGFSMGFLITAAILSTPLGSFDVVKVSFVYFLVLVSGIFVFPLPLIFFSTAINIVSSAVVGSYAVIFSISLFVGSSLGDIILRVVKNIAFKGFLSTNGYCEMSTIDIMLSCAWALLCILSITFQASIEVARRRSFKKKQALQRQYTRSESEGYHPERKFSSFPSASLFTQLKRRSVIRKRDNLQFEATGHGRGSPRPGGERRPLLSPSTLTSNRYRSLSNNIIGNGNN